MALGTTDVSPSGPEITVMLWFAPLSSNVTASPLKNLCTETVAPASFQLVVLLMSQDPLPPLPAAPVQVIAAAPPPTVTSSELLEKLGMKLAGRTCGSPDGAFTLGSAASTPMFEL